MDDRQIIILYNQRDETAISETSKKYGNYCFAIANNILFNQQDSEECVNDTWLRTWNTIPPQNPDCLKLYVAKITRNLSLDRLKSNTRDKRGGGEVQLALDEVGEFISDQTRVDSELEQEAFMQSLNRFLYSLPARDCNIFIRRYFYIQPTKQIAQLYLTSEGNVLKILSRTRKKLKKHLETEGYTI